MEEPERSNGPRSEAFAEVRSAGHARVRYNKAMRLVRRAHLYLGLYMTPWVFLYGVSAFLLNHPEVYSEKAVRLDPGLASGATGGGAPRADELAARVVEALNRAEAEAPADGPGASPRAPYRLVEPARAEFNRELMATVRTADGNQLARIDMTDGTITLRPLATRTAPPSPFSPKPSVKLALRPFDPAVDGLTELLKARGVPAEASFLRLAPDLSFLMERDGEIWRTTYNGQNGVAVARPASFENPSPGFSRFLILMHVAHTFPAKLGARWVWAVLVDLMFLSMVGWGVTGLLMWWQMKNLRRVGVFVLIASALTAAALAAGMHAAFVAEGLS